MDLSSRVANTGSRLHFLCLSSTGTVEFRHFLHFFPLGFVFLPSWKRGDWCSFPRILQNFLRRKVRNLAVNFLSPASGKTVFSSTWRCVDSSDICWPFNRFVRHTPSVYWGVLQRLALRFFFIAEFYVYWRMVAQHVNFFFIFPCNCT